MKKGIWLLVLLVCLAGLTACGADDEPGPEEALADFVRLWERGNYQEMYAMLSESAQQKWDEDLFTSRHANISSGIGLEYLELELGEEDEEQQPDQGEVLNYAVEFRTRTVGNFSQQYTMEVEQVEGEWRLHWDHCHIFPQLTDQHTVRVTRQMPQRGKILDRNYEHLAVEGSVYNVGLVPGRLEEGSLEQLSEVLALPVSRLEQQLAQSWVRDDTFVPVQHISQQFWQQQEHALRAMPGVMVRQEEGRVYNIPQSLAQTIGYVGEVDSERLRSIEDQGFRAGDILGRAGLELDYDSQLAGQPGFTITINKDDETQVLAQRPPVDGEDVHTTLDLLKVRMLDAALGDNVGSMILVNHQTGDIAALASTPGFDSNHFALGITPDQYQQLEQLDSPYLNRAFNGLYPPGSVFKPFTALMALEQGVVDPDEAWDTPRQWQSSPAWGSYYVTRVTRPSGEVDLWEAMKWSDNVYFADLGLRLGWDNFSAYGAQLGFGEDIPFDLNYRQSQLGAANQSEVMLADTSFGQGEMLATPLHMTMLYSALARQDGAVPIPRLVESTQPGIWRQVEFSTDNLDLVDRTLAYTASDEAALAWVGRETVRGKTGTSEISQQQQIAWYICYFDDYVLTVALEGDDSISSVHAAAVAREILNMGIGD